jgi:hypothetical protein
MRPRRRRAGVLTRPAPTFAATDPAEALAELRAFEGPALIDLDETLYLANSTEDFIDTAVPQLAAAVILRLLDLIGPWRLTGRDTRDVWRVRVVVLLFPWTLLLWRRRVAHLAAGRTNDAVRQAIRARRGDSVIVTLGFRPVVGPLVDAMALGSTRLVAARLWTTADRRRGKLAFAADALGEDTVRRSLVLTDSVNDGPILNVARRPLLTTWPEARFRPAFEDVYLPGLYLTRIKRPGAAYIRRGILQDDFVLWLLSSLWLASLPILAAAGLLCLLVSFWAVYEQGYVDNDRIAANHESEPRLSDAYGRVRVATPLILPWIWAAAAGLAGLVLLRWPALPSPVDLAIWTAVLVATAACFRIFNRLDKPTRVWPYGLLQLARCAAFVPLVPVVPAAPAVIGAAVIEKWVPYLCYRLAGRDGWELPLPLMRLGFLAVLLVLLSAVAGAGLLVELPTLALVAWTTFRARRDLRAVAARRRWIVNDGA